MYYGKPPRLYVLSRREVDSGIAFCPKCRGVLEIVPFKKSEKLYRCQCGFHIEKSSVSAEPIKDIKVEILAQKLVDDWKDGFYQE